MDERWVLSLKRGKITAEENEMRAHRLEVTVPDDHHLTVDLPSDFPAGPAEVIVLSAEPKERRIVRLGGALSPEGPVPQDDPIAETLEELREERAGKLARRAEELDTSPPGRR